MLLGIKLNEMQFNSFMADNLYEIDAAMNMIKEDIIRELSECVSKQNENVYYRKGSSNNLSFSDKTLD